MNLNNLNPNVRNVEYAVRGEIAILAETLKDKLNKGENLPFNEITNINIGNPQQLKQKPITFFRQVSSLVENPDLLLDENREKVEALYPIDVIERAKKLVSSAGGSVGAYSHSMGIPYIRQQVAKFIEERDGYPADPEKIFLTAGASPAVQMILQCMIDKPNVGVMIPIPQYPLYTASLALFNSRAVPYYLNEEKAWGMDPNDLKEAIHKARQEGTDVRALVIINPGNPTGQCLSDENMKEIIEFCHRERLVLCADEVYQTNTYSEDLPFHSFKKILRSMGPDYEDFELFSFHSISKGVIGECGRRGGYVECVGIDPHIVEQMYKLASISLCPNVQGQIMVELMVNPPNPGEPSYDLYKKETDDIYHSLIRRSVKLYEAFNNLEGVTCSKAEGAMYLFPQIRLPARAIEAAKTAGKQPDAYYSLEMLKATGICVVPGSGFGQKDGTWHFRATFLPPEHTFDEFINLLKNFHEKFMDQHRD
ncbi:PLP-dependent transferase [Basidiobolus meristosporus CBS 931.73]|uniref:Glutamate pyruvate transaminase n=1 Tax=Basidiobolus meristosporus CBS 931.73 TaxID=1314790 RepID=A0A1Y1XU02_9FUNG|nr:PLP-dependent transferase [Basidiobolus meristosporus CBS 931.73]|eukprot:ORX89228.1 PLP-dependent transferase [Basidiobolus meristosporus CBS 931.73]